MGGMRSEYDWERDTHRVGSIGSTWMIFKALKYRIFIIVMTNNYIDHSLVESILPE